MTTLLPEFMQHYKQRCEAALEQHYVNAALRHPAHAPEMAVIAEAVEYATRSPGKRVRPCLVYAAAESLAADETNDDALDSVACAIELIHTYSLIHDDLPAMDDDDLRRGKPTLHRAYDEATAILAGDALQAGAFQLIADTAGLSAQKKLRIISRLAQASGLGGMVGGQYIDIAATGRDLDLKQLRAMHALKTGALISAALAMGGIATGATGPKLKALDNYGGHIGLAFQVVDDILDVVGDTGTLGKTQGKDEEADKPTYVKLMGLEGARAEAQRLLTSALAALDAFGEQADKLRDLARYIVARDC